VGVERRVLPKRECWIYGHPILMLEK
jgi:hypothetical protein